MADLYQGGTPQLRRSSPRQTERSIPGLSMDRAVVKHRQFLDKVYGHISDPFKQWSLKRDSLKRMVERAKPDYDKSDLDVIYNQFGLSDSSTPGDFTREQGVWSSASRAMDIAGKSFGQLYDTAGMLYDRETGDKEGMMENQRQIQQAQHESAVIRQFEIGPEEDRNIIKQFVFDLTASAPVMAGIMGVGFVGGLALAKVGVVAWLAGMLGMGAADALTEVGFNYADIVGDPGVREKIEKALGEKMTDATEEEIGLAVQKHLMDQADDSAVKVGLANFFNPLNAPQFTALRGLIKPGSASLGAIRRAAFQSGTREGVEEFLQSSGSQFYAEEAKTKAMIDAGVEDAAEPEGLQAKLGEYVDWGQSFYEGMMGVTVGAFIGGGQGYRGHVKYMAGKAEADASGNLKYKKPGDENFIPAGQLRFQTRQIVDMPDEGQGLESLDLFLQERAKADPREEEIVRDEISKMKAGSPLLGERSTPEKRSNRKTFLSNYKEGTHLTPEQASGSVDPAAPTVAELNASPELRAEYKLISDLKEEDRSDYEIRFLKVAEQFPDLDYKQLQTVVDNSIKHGWTQDGGATGWRKAAEAERKSKERKEPAKRGEQVAKPAEDEDLSWMEEKPDETLAERDVRQSRIEAQERIWAEEERESGLQVNETPEETEQRHVREAAETEVRRERARLSQEDVQRIMRQRGEAVGDTGTTLDEHGKVIDTPPTKAPERTAVSLTENELDRGGSSTEITNLLNEWGAEIEHKGKEGQNNKNLKLMKQFVLRTENKGKVRSVVVEKTGDAREKQLKKKEQNKKYSLTHTEFYFTPEQRLAIATEIAATLGLSAQPTVKVEVTTVEEEVTAVVDEEVEGETVEVVADEAEVVEEEAGRKINRNSPNKKHYNRNNEAVEQTVDDSGIDDLIGTVVAIETGKGRGKRDNVPIRKEGGLDAAPSGENIPAGTINTGEYVPSTEGTSIKFIRFEGIKDNGDINFVDLKYDKLQERAGQTIAKLIRSKRPVGKGQAENALRHLQTGVEKTWIKFKPSSTEGSASFATVSREAYEDYVSDTYTEESTVDMAESDQAIAVRSAQQELTNLKNELNSTVKQNMVAAHFDIVVNAIDESLGLKKYNKKQLKKIENLLVGKYKPTKTEKDLFNRINDARERLNFLLSAVKAPKISVRKGKEKKEKPRRSKLGDEQRDINIRIGNLTEALKDGKLSNEDKIRIIDDMERTARELGARDKREINLKLDDVVLETGATQVPPVAGMRQWLVVHIAEESRDINPTDLLRIIRLSGYKLPALQFYVERPEGQFGMEIAEPIKIEDKKYFVTEEEQKNLDEAWKRWKSEQDNLQHALTVRMRGPLKGTNVMGGSKAEPPTTAEAEGKPSAKVIPFPEPKTKTGTISEVVNYDSGDKYVGEVKIEKDGRHIRHGSGTYTFKDGEKYVGEWKNDKRNGQGVLTYTNGNKYDGEFKDDKRTGQGTFTSPNGDKYIGEFRDGKPWRGTQYDKDANVTEIWSKGKSTISEKARIKKPTPKEEVTTTTTPVTSPVIEIKSVGMGVELHFSKPIPIKSGFKSEGVALTDELIIGVTNKKNEEVGYAINEKGRMDINNILSPKAVDTPHYSPKEAEAMWINLFGAEKVQAAKDILAGIKYLPGKTFDIQFKNRAIDIAAFDEVLSVLLPGTRGAIKIGDALGSDTTTTIGAGKPVVKQTLPLRKGLKGWGKEKIKEFQDAVDNVIMPEEVDESVTEEEADGTVEVSGWEEQMTISTDELETALAAGKDEELSKVYLKRLKGDPRYSTDLSQWDGTEFNSTADFTRKIKADLGIDPDEKTTKFSDGYKETGALSRLIRDKLMNHIEYEFIRVNSIAGQGRLRNEIEAKWWPILSSDQKKKINARLKTIASGGKPGSAASKIKQIPHTILKKKSIVKAEPVNADFLSENMESATRKVPTKKPKVPSVWQIIPSEARSIFEPLATTKKSKEELKEFLDKVKNIFIVVFKKNKWFALEVIPDQPLTGEGLAVPLAIRKKLTRDAKSLDTEKPKDQISRKLTYKELTDREGGASERLVQLYKTENISAEIMEAMADKRIGYTDITKVESDEGKVVEVWWLDKDGNWEVDGESNQGYIIFKDSESATKFDESIKNIDQLKAAQIDKQAQWEKHELLFTSDLQEHITEETLRGVNVRDVEDYSIDVTEDVDISDDAIESDLEKMIKERTDPNWKEDLAQDENITTDDMEISLGGIEDTFAWSREEDTKTILDNLKNRKTTSESREVDGKPREFLSMEEVKQQVEEFRSEYTAAFPVEIVETHTDLPSTQDESATSGMIEDGKVWIVRDRMYDKETVLKNLWHEEIGHLGIENFLGEAKFGELVNDLQEILPEDVKQDYLERIPADFGSLEARKTQSMKEYLAYNAEEQFRNVPATVWEKIVSWFREALRGAGVKIDFNGLDLKMLILRSADKLRGTTAATMIQGTGIKQRRAERSTIINTEGLDSGTVKFFDKLYPEEEGRFAGWNWAALKTKLVSKIFDPFLVINQKIGKVPYMQTRLANRSDGVLAAKLRYSGVKPVKTVIDGVTVNELKADKTVKALFTILKPLGKRSEINRFAGWIVALRANMLKGEERERFFSNDEIQEGLKANQGRIKDARTGATTSRELVYKQVAADLARWNKSVVDLGIGFGLFDSKSASAWNTEWYMPFFRLYENQIGEDKQRGVANYKNLTDQKGVHKLLGSEKGLKNPMNNLVKNALHIIDASIKNDAAVLTLQEAAKIRDPDTGMMLAEELKQGEETARSVRVIKNGFDKYYNINNQLLFEALASLHSDTKFAGFGWAVKAKGLFTQIVTASPVFKYWNVLRDTMSAAGTTDVGYNLFKNSVGGFMSLKEMQGDMLISGAYIQFAYNRSDDPNYAMSLLTKEMSTGFIAANPENHKGFRKAWELSRKLTSGVWGRYQAFGDKLENANRAAIYKGLMEKNKSMTESAFEARDLLDFTLHGSADWVRLVTALTPFANAMLQGKYKLGRAIINNPKPVVVVSSAMVLASLMEYYIYEEDEEWHRRPDWDKDTFFWIKLPGTDTRFRMPKPHEFSLIGNLAWRGIQMAKEKDPVHGPLLASAIRSVLFREFNVSPIPQVVKPLIEVGINKNLFFDRPIEPLGVKNLSPSEKRGMYTSETMIMLSKGMENILWDEVVLSPYQLEHIVNGYFGWLGQTVLAGTDSVVRKTFDFPEKPAAELMDHPIARKLFQASPIRNTRAGGIFYERLKEIEQASADLNLAKKLGDWEHYREIYEEKKDLLKWKSFMRKKQRILNNINKRIRKVRFDKSMSAESKRVRMDRFYSIRNRILDILAKSPAMR